MADPQNEKSLGRAGVDDPVVPDSETEKAREFPRQGLAGCSRIREGFVDLPEDPRGDATIEPVEVSRDRGLVLNPCGGQSAS